VDVDIGPVKKATSELKASAGGKLPAASLSWGSLLRSSRSSIRRPSRTTRYVRGRHLGGDPVEEEAVRPVGEHRPGEQRRGENWSRLAGNLERTDRSLPTAATTYNLNKTDAQFDLLSFRLKQVLNLGFCFPRRRKEIFPFSPPSFPRGSLLPAAPFHSSCAPFTSLLLALLQDILNCLKWRAAGFALAL